jgi:phosphate transport system substrate-binding protein
MVDKLSDFAAQVNPEDIAVFFYAGHGVALGGQNFILPSDIPAPRSTGRGEEQRLADRAVGETTITDRLMGAKVAIMVMDSCRNNPLAASSGRSIGTGRGLVRPPDTRGVLSIYSAGIGQEALDRLGDSDPNPNSVFTRVFIEALKQPGVGIREAAFKTQGEVARLAASAGQDQVPGVYSQILGDDIVLGNPAKQPPAIVKTQPAPAADPEQQAFLAAMQRDDAAALDDFLAQHPSGGLADLARRERERLAKASRPPKPLVVPPEPPKEPERVAVLPPEKSPDEAAVAPPLTTQGLFNVTGAGSTLLYPILQKWSESFSRGKGGGLNYQSIGSGGGIKQIKAKTVTFGATDVPLTAQDLDDSRLLQWPLVVSGIVPIVNLPGVAPGDLVLDGPTLAQIYLGTITVWNDPALARLNPRLALPASQIVIVHRSDGSGTNFGFTSYLDKVSPDWRDKIGVSVAPEWPTGIGAKGNSGVATNVATTPGAIGYVEYGFAKQSPNLAYASMVNRDSRIVQPSLDTLSAAAANGDWAHALGFSKLLVDQPGTKSWPLAFASFILMQRTPYDVAQAKGAINFFAWALDQGSQDAKSLDYAPLPASLAALVKAEMRKIVH